MPCPPDALEAALEVLYQRVPADVRHQLVIEVQQEAARGDIDLSGLWIARKQNGQIVGALLTQTLAGKAAAIWAPEVRSGWRSGVTAAALVQKSLLDLEQRGFRLAQAVLDESADQRAARDLTKGGMPRVTELLYLERNTAEPLPTIIERPPRVDWREGHLPSPHFEWQPFEPAREAEFRAVLQMTYVGSLDMPELEAVRSLDDIMESHRATGRFVANRWYLGRLPGKPDASSVLLLSEIPGSDVWEVVYLGLTPAARGLGLGRVVIRHALELAGQHVSQIQLAVDCRNKPATRLYEAMGFTIRDRRAVHLALLGEPQSRRE
jgi:ribosomal protein S18 acetylase RimI-like enzyme